MLVVDDLRVPLVVHDLGHSFGFRHVVHEEIAIVVVADIVVIKLRRSRLLEWRAELALVPLADDLETIGIHHRH